jgi:hypothetical protein
MHMSGGKWLLSIKLTPAIPFYLVIFKSSYIVPTHSLVLQYRFLVGIAIFNRILQIYGLAKFQIFQSISNDRLHNSYEVMKWAWVTSVHFVPAISDDVSVTKGW